MDTWMHDAIAAAFEEMYELIAGDYVVHVTKTGTQTPLLTVMDDVWIGEGLLIDPAGIRDQNSRDLCFHKNFLAAEGVSIAPTDHFLIDGERWDYQEDSPLKDALNPLAGIQDIIVVRVRRAVELEKSQAGSNWGFNP